MAGIEEFIAVAKESLNSVGLTLCPCFNCANKRLHNIDIIRAHLIRKGIDDLYTRWVYHGEKEPGEEKVYFSRDSKRHKHATISVN